MKPQNASDPEFQVVIQHLVKKVVERTRAGERTIQLKISRERHERYGGRLGPELNYALESAGLVCYVSQWTGLGHTGVQEITIEPN